MSSKGASRWVALAGHRLLADRPSPRQRVRLVAVMPRLAGRPSSNDDYLRQGHRCRPDRRRRRSSGCGIASPVAPGLRARARAGWPGGSSAGRAAGRRSLPRFRSSRTSPRRVRSCGPGDDRHRLRGGWRAARGRSRNSRCARIARSAVDGATNRLPPCIRRIRFRRAELRGQSRLRLTCSASSPGRFSRTRHSPVRDNERDPLNGTAAMNGVAQGLR